MVNIANGWRPETANAAGPAATASLGAEGVMGTDRHANRHHETSQGDHRHTA